MIRTPVALLSLCTVAALGAVSCGAGLFGSAAGLAEASSDDPGTPQARITQRIPSPGSTSQPRATPLVLGFSAPIRAPLDPDLSVDLTFDGVVVDGTLRSSGNSLVFEPQRPLALGRSHTIRWRGSLEFDGAQGLDVDETWTFDVADGTWQEPELVLTFSLLRAAASSSEGRLVAISRGELMGGPGQPVFTIFGSVQRPDRSWGSPLTIIDEFPGLFAPDVVWNRAGDGILASLLDNSDARFFTLSPDSGEPWRELDSVALFPFDPQVRIFHDANDRPRTVYATTEARVAMRLLDGGGHWTPYVLLSDDLPLSGVKLLPIQSTPDGHAIVGWIYDASPTFHAGRLQYRIADSQGEFGRVRTFDLPAASFGVDPGQRRPALVADGAGGMCVVFAGGTGLDPGIYVSFTPDGVSFAPPWRIDGEFFSEAQVQDFDAAHMGNGRFLIVFRARESVDANHAVYAVDWTPTTGALPSTPTLVSASPVAPTQRITYQAPVLLGREGFGATAIWLRRDEQNGSGAVSSRLEARRVSADGIWGERVTISSGTNGCPTFARQGSVGDRGDLSVLWTELANCQNVPIGTFVTTDQALAGLSARFD